MSTRIQTALSKLGLRVNAGQLVGRASGGELAGLDADQSRSLLGLGTAAVTAASAYATAAQGAKADTATQPANLVGFATGAAVANTLADNVIGAVPVLFRVAIAGGAAATKTITSTHKLLIVDAWAVMTGAGEEGDMLQITTGGETPANISDALAWSGAAGSVVRAGNLANATIDAAGTFAVTTTDSDEGGDVAAGTVYLLAIRIA